MSLYRLRFGPAAEKTRAFFPASFQKLLGLWGTFPRMRKRTKARNPKSPAYLWIIDGTF